MPRIEIELETDVAPARVESALLDFTERRPELWPGIEPSLYEVYSVAETSADIREGSVMPGMRIWAREHYDWSTPGLITWTVQESNFCAPGSFVSAAISPRDGGGSRIAVVWSRTPTSFAGRLATTMIRLTRGTPVAASFRMGMDRVQALDAATAEAAAH